MGRRGGGDKIAAAVLVLVVGLYILSAAMAGTEQGEHSLALGWIPAMSEGCHGTIAECSTSGDEFAMDSEITRRVLATSGYISYGALKRGTVPCSRRGASYYNCRPGAQANPYSRGCSAITRCRTS